MKIETVGFSDELVLGRRDGAAIACENWRVRCSRRRALMGLAAGAAFCGGVCGAEAAPPSYEVKRLTAKGKNASRFDLLVPKHLGKDARVRLVVALHGLGESHDAELGAAAWVDRYGLGTSYERLLAPPVVKTGKRGRERNQGEHIDKRKENVLYVMDSSVMQQRHPLPGYAGSPKVPWSAAAVVKEYRSRNGLIREDQASLYAAEKRPEHLPFQTHSQRHPPCFRLLSIAKSHVKRHPPLPDLVTEMKPNGEGGK